MKNGSPSVVEELEGVISAMAHVVAAVIVELPEPSKSILLDFVGGDDEEDEDSPKQERGPDGDDCDDSVEEELSDLSPEFLRGSARFQGMVLAIARHFDDECEPYLERRERFRTGEKGSGGPPPQGG